MEFEPRREVDFLFVDALCVRGRNAARARIERSLQSERCGIATHFCVRRSASIGISASTGNVIDAWNVDARDVHAHARSGAVDRIQTMRSLVLIVAFAAAGCASTSAETPFQDTAKLVEPRTGHRIQWDQGGDDDQAVARNIRVLLSRDLTVDSAVQVALLNNKSLQATYEDLSIAQADLVQAGLLKNPVFGAGLEFPIAGDVQTGGSLSVSEDFLSIFTLAARKRIAASALDAAERRVGDAVVRMSHDVETAFFTLQATMQIAAMRRTILEAGDAALDLATRQHDAGNISDLDLANEDALYEQLRTDLIRSDADVVATRESLARLLGVWGSDAAYRVQAKLPELPAKEASLEHLESLAVTRRLDLQAAHAEAQTISHALAMTKSFRWLGDASVGAAYSRGPERYSTVGPTGSVELPIFDQKRAAVARLEAELRAALAREHALAVDVRSEVREAVGRLTASRSVVERYAQVVIPLRQRVVALSQEQYDAMLLGTYQLLQSKQSEVNAYREFIEALRDYWIARADLERATGGALTNVEPNQTNRGAR